jgi:hypothetical protein
MESPYGAGSQHRCHSNECQRSGADEARRETLDSIDVRESGFCESLRPSQLSGTISRSRHAVRLRHGRRSRRTTMCFITRALRSRRIHIASETQHETARQEQGEAENRQHQLI